jgi:hypothetical protein
MRRFVGLFAATIPACNIWVVGQWCGKQRQHMARPMLTVHFSSLY